VDTIRVGTRGEALLLEETCVALLRKRTQWSAVSIQGKRFGWNPVFPDKPQAQADLYFQQLKVAERAKVVWGPDLALWTAGKSKQGSIITSISSWLKHSSITSSSSSNTSSSSTTVMSLVVVVRGRSQALGAATEAGVASALQNLAAEALIEKGQNIISLSVLWAPRERERGVGLSDRELLLNYPELISIL